MVLVDESGSDVPSWGWVNHGTISEAQEDLRECRRTSQQRGEFSAEVGDFDGLVQMGDRHTTGLGVEQHPT